MSAENVSTLKSEVNATLDDACVWALAMGERGIYNPTSARLRKTAINQLETILAADEPRTVVYVLEHLKQIANRWAVKNQGSPDTASTYESRVRGTLNDYVAYLKSPTSFAPRVARSQSPSRPAKKGVGSQQPPSGEFEIASTSPQPVSVSPMHSCPLGKDRDPFRYEMPKEGLCMAEVLRIAIHLASGAHDFDPTKQVVVLNHYSRLPDGNL